MLVVLDTNIFVKDFRMKGTAFRILFESMSKLDAQLCMPEIVHAEVINKFREELQRRIEESQKSVAELSKLMAKTYLRCLTTKALKLLSMNT